MLIEHRHDRMANAILYFTSRTRECTKTKLMHLLYLLDFEHFAVTGRCVTGSTYCALPSGPVPTELYWEFNRPAGVRSYLDDLVQAQCGDSGASTSESPLLPLLGPVDDDFTRRQISLMANIAAEFSSGGQSLTERVCANEQPWHKVYCGGRGGHFAVIPYELMLDGVPNRELILESAREHLQFRQRFAAK